MNNINFLIKNLKLEYNATKDELYKINGKTNINEFEKFLTLVNYFANYHKQGYTNNKQLEQGMKIIKKFLNLFEDKELNSKMDKDIFNYLLNL